MNPSAQQGLPSSERRDCVLVIDDQPDSLDLFSLLIRTFLPDVEVVTTTDGPAGLRIALERRPQLVLLDVKMPGMDGYEVCRRLKANPLTADIPVLMVSGVLTSTPHRVEGLKVGAEGYLCKPFEPQEFIAQISSLLRLKRQSDTLRDRERHLENELDRRTVALRESETQYRHLVEALPLMVLLVREDRILFANAAAARSLAGVPPAMLKGRVFSEFEAEVVSPASFEDSRHYETVWRRADGREFPVEVYRHTIALSEGPAEQVLGSDITERKAAEQRLFQAEERYRTLVEQLPAIIYILRLRPSLRFEYLSPQVESFLGGRLSEWMEDYDRWVESIHPDDRGRVVAKLAENGTAEGQALEYRMRGRDGREVWFRDQRRLIPEADGGPIVHGVMVDITARKNAETALRQKEEQLRHSQKMEALGGLAGGIAHDFNNLLTTILGYGHLLLEQKKLDSEGRADLAEIIHAGERAERLTRQLLAFSRKQAIETAPTDINEVVTEMERLLRRTLGEDIELVTVLSDDAGCILAETGQLEQVLMNLAVNARSAMPRGGRLVITTRRVRLDEEFCRMRELLPGEYVLLEVSDTGCGMTPEVRERIFEPFFTTKKDGEGTGLGLATVYGIVRGFGGIIEVDSEVEKGTRFRMYFPHLESHEAPRPGTETSEAPGGTETILLVEDDASVRRLTSRFLASLGYNVLEASNSGEALMIFERPGTRVDLLLTDIVMPHVSGVETATRLRQIWPGLRVLYMTGFARETSALLSEDADAPVIFKPFNRATLARRVRQALDAASAANSSTSEA